MKVYTCFRYVREWISGMACAGIVDHCEIDGLDRYWIAPHRLPALIGTELTHEHCSKKVMYNAQRGEQMVGALGDYQAVEKCYAKDGPPGELRTGAYLRVPSTLLVGC